MDKQDSQSHFQKWLQYLKDLGKTDEQIKQLVGGFAKFSSLNAYAAIMASLTEEDMKKIEKIADEAQAQEEMKKVFSQRTGMTLEQLVASFREDFAKNYLE